MKSTRYADGLRYLAQGNFSIATMKFKILLADSHTKDPAQKANILYCYAVASLGVLLTKLVKESKEIKEIKEIKDIKEIKEIIGSKEINKTKENRETKEFKKNKLGNNVSSIKQFLLEKMSHVVGQVSSIFDEKKQKTKTLIRLPKNEIEKTAKELKEIYSLFEDAKKRNKA